MNIVRNILTELVSLFIDDWLFAILLIAWIGLFTIPALRLHMSATGPLFFTGIAGLILAFVVRQAKELKK